MSWLFDDIHDVPHADSHDIATHSYAPAYQRYGRGILAAHFIGADKPWSRARPQRSRSQAPYSSSSSVVAVNDYRTLLSKWHDLFEQHYGRPADGTDGGEGEVEVRHTDRGVEIIERVEKKGRKFVVPTYEAVWDAVGAQSQHQPPFSSSQQQQRSAGKIDDLKRFFASGPLSSNKFLKTWGGMEIYLDEKSVSAADAGEKGVYFSMPIEGRLSLLPPKSLPWLDESPLGSPDPRDEHQRQLDAAAEEGRVRGTDGSGDGAWTPPKSGWNAQFEPPPATTGTDAYQMRNPPPESYANVWDDENGGRDGEAFFRTRNVRDERIPAHLAQQGMFDHLGSDRPDPSRVKAVFPWEMGGRGAPPMRVFPDEPRFQHPGYASYDQQQQHQAERAPTPQLRQRMSSQQQQQHDDALGITRGLPATLSYSNAWDEDPSIGIYADRVSNHITRNRSSSRSRSSYMDQEAQRSASGGSRRAHFAQQPERPLSFVEPPNQEAKEEEGDDESSEGVDSEDDSDDDEEQDATMMRPPVPSSGSGGGASTRRRKSWRRQAPSAEYQRRAEAYGYGHHASPRTGKFAKLPNVSTSPTSSIAGGVPSYSHQQGSAGSRSGGSPHIDSSPTFTRGSLA